jgi:trans-2,3-dihydro-3-hydroxyanthranilate isomerase
MALGLGRLGRHAGHVATVEVPLWQGGAMDLAYRIVNVFTVGDDPFSGNPLAVFEDAADVSDEQMQAIARQLNLSETTFVTGPGDEGVDADVRIFTPEYELPFAGHPTLGTAYVVSSLRSGRESVVLGMPAGRVPVSYNGSRWVFTTAVAPTTRAVDVAAADLAAMIGVDADDVEEGALWVDTGVE